MAEDMASKEGYRVLARKYRPSTFDDLIGQEPMVRTLTNAFALGRIAQAYMLTGVRGVGKTTTARIVARGLNYESMDGAIARPTVDMPGLGKHCQAIMESRHVDVIEMDAASHTGIDDIRDIIESAQYRPASARYKVFIIDEVHMLSKAAFNGLLKTLEEPPAHVKFIFATTEIRKVPVTVLSRCQRFDLRRVPQELLVDHLTRIASLEGGDLRPDAAAALARAAQGSVRDALSLLDQAMAQGGEVIEAEAVNQMLGLADQGRVIDLFKAIAEGDAREALAILSALYDVGADPLTVLNDLATLTHAITRHRVAPDATARAGLDEATARACETFGAALSLPVLSRLWQMLLKGIEEVGQASLALPAAEMVVIRLAHVADIPTPDDLIKMLDGKGGSAAAPAASNGGNGGAPRAPQGVQGAPRAYGGGQALSRDAAPSPSPHQSPRAETVAHVAPGPKFRTLEDIAAYVKDKRDLKLAYDIEQYLELVAIEGYRLEVRLASDAPATLVGELGQKMSQWLGARFVVILTGRSDAPLKTIAARREENFVSEVEAAKADPLVRALLASFPDASIMDVRKPALLSPEDEAAPPPPDEDGEDEDGLL